MSVPGEAAVLPQWYLDIASFLFGACIGSFLNVVIARLPRGESLVRPGSRCPGCRRPIRWYENVPILSWLALRGRCRGCAMRISPRYLLVELAGGLLALACVRKLEPLPWAVACFGFLAALVALTYIDLEHWLLPRRITIPFIALGIGAAFLPGGPEPTWSLLGAAAGFASFVTLGFVAEKLLRKEALGGGDVWLFAMIGAWLGLGALLPIVLLASVQGAASGAVLLLAVRRRRDGPLLPGPKPTGDAEVDEWVAPKGALPFGPFLSLGAAEHLFFGEQLVRWYLDLLGRAAVTLWGGS